MVNLTIKTSSIARNGTIDTGSVYLDDEEPESPSLRQVARRGGSVRRKVAIFEQKKSIHERGGDVPYVLTPAKKADRRQMPQSNSKNGPSEFSGNGDEQDSVMRYDLTPVTKAEQRQTTDSYSMDPFEFSAGRDEPEMQQIAYSSKYKFYSE